jgi:hypothetical protein
MKPKTTDSRKKRGSATKAALTKPHFGRLERLAQLERKAAEVRQAERALLADVVTGKLPWEFLKVVRLPREAAPDEPSLLLAASAIQAVLDVAGVNQLAQLDDARTAAVEVAIEAIRALFDAGDGAAMKRARAALLGGRGEEATEALHREALAIVTRCLKQSIDPDTCLQALMLKDSRFQRLTKGDVTTAMSRRRAQPPGILAELYLGAGLEKKLPTETIAGARARLARTIKRSKKRSK